MTSQTPLGQGPKAGSPASSSAGSHPNLGSPPQDSNSSPTPSGAVSVNATASSSSSSSAAAAAAAAAANQKQVLSEEQKKANHIASEKKRRNNIREQYDKLAEMIPGMAGQGRSEGRVLEEAVKMATQLVQDRQAMIDQIKSTGGHVDPRLYDEIERAIKVIRESSPRQHGGRSSESQGNSFQTYIYQPGWAATNIYVPQVSPTSYTIAGQGDMLGHHNRVPHPYCLPAASAPSSASNAASAYHSDSQRSIPPAMLGFNLATYPAPCSHCGQPYTPLTPPESASISYNNQTVIGSGAGAHVASTHHPTLSQLTEAMHKVVGHPADASDGHPGFESALYPPGG